MERTIEALMAAGREKNAKTSARGYSLLDVDYYREGTPGILAACMEGPYDDVVIDFGQLQSGIREDWLRCGTKILTASLSEWKLGVFLEFLEREMRPGSGWIYAAAFGSEDTRKRMERRFGISLKRIPLSVDAFSVDSRVKDWLEGILK